MYPVELGRASLFYLIFNTVPETWIATKVLCLILIGLGKAWFVPIQTQSVSVKLLKLRQVSVHSYSSHSILKFCAVFFIAVEGEHSSTLCAVILDIE